MQRSHTLPIVLTLGVACGSACSGTKAAPHGADNVDKGTTVVTMTTRPTIQSIAIAAAMPDAGVPDALPIDPDPPKLTCDAGTFATPAPFPEPTWFCAGADGKRNGPFFTLFPDMQIEIEGRYKDGKLDGAWTRHYLGGAIAEQGAYVAGQADGVWRQLDASGNVLGTYTLKKGTGKQKRWLDDGPLYSELTLYKGVPNGPMKIYDRDGHVVVAAKLQMGKPDDDKVIGWKNTLRIEETYEHGHLDGPRKIWQFWALMFEETYANGKLDGAFTIWRDGNKKIPRVVGNYEHGKKIGLWVWTDKNNKTEREGAFVDGKKNGGWTEYTDGIVTFQGTYADGKPDGDFIYFDAKGLEIGRFTITAGTGTMLTFYANKKVASKAHVVDGLLSGKYEELTVRGKTVVEGYYAGDKKHGWWREWTELGVPTLEEHYKHGKLDGVVHKFEEGKVVVESNYKDGKAEGKYTEYRAGKPSLVGQFAGDKRVGTWTTYDDAGAATLSATYKDGVLDGAWKQRIEGVTIEGTMLAGRRSGTWTRTDRAGTVTTTTVKTP